MCNVAQTVYSLCFLSSLLCPWNFCKLKINNQQSTVKLIAQRKFKSLRADEMTLYYRDGNTSGHPEHLADDDKDLAYYGVQNGGEIMMEESVGDNIKTANGENDEDESQRAKREQIETMEAIRMAQREEVEAAKGAATSASNAVERKVNAADVVPFISKLR